MLQPSVHLMGKIFSFLQLNQFQKHSFKESIFRFLALCKSGIWSLHHSQGHVQAPWPSQPDLWLSADPESVRIDFHSGSCPQATL